MENVGTFIGHLEYTTDIWYILGPSGNLVPKLVCFFPRFGTLYQEKSGNPGAKVPASLAQYSGIRVKRDFLADFQLGKSDFCQI
jgi:hypothetical protein